MDNCEKCGGKLSMYCEPWCPKCDKPVIKLVPTLNLIKCLEYLEANGHKGIKNRVWDYCMDCDYIKNDTTFTLYFGDELDPDEQDTMDLLLIKDTWGIKDECIDMVVSW